MTAIVIGAGISGLSCAYRLQRSGVAVTLLEGSEAVGGLISSVRQDGFLFELGPQSFLSSGILLELIDSLGIRAELLVADPKAPRYVVVAGRLQPVPMTPPSLLFTSLLGPRSKSRLLRDLLGHSRPPETDESVAAFVRRKFGSELLERLVAPFISGVYAGDPEKLSLRRAFPSVYQWEREFGSVLRGAMKSRPAKDKARPPRNQPPAGLCAFREGNATLAHAVEKALGDKVQRGARVNAVRRANTGGSAQFEVEVSRGARSEVLIADAVVLAVPTSVAGGLVSSESKPLAGALSRIEYAPVAVVAAGYRREQIGIPVNGFGFLVPRIEKRRILGTVWNSSLFPGRAPDGMVALTSFAGGATDSELCTLSEDRIAEIVLGELGAVMKISGSPVTCLVKRYPQALPQYNLGHGELVAELQSLAMGIPGLFFAGNYLQGPSVVACVEQAYGTADAARAFLANRDATQQTAQRATR